MKKKPTKADFARWGAIGGSAKGECKRRGGRTKKDVKAFYGQIASQRKTYGNRYKRGIPIVLS